MKTTYRKLYKFETLALAEAWIAKTNPAEKLDFYIEEFNTFFYNDLNTKVLIEQGASDFLLLKEYKFITGEELDGDNNYYLSKDDFGKLLVVFIDSNVYQDAHIRFPEGYMGTDSEINGKEILLYFLDTGLFQTSATGEFIRPLSFLDCFNGSSDPNAGKTVTAEFISMQLFNNNEKLQTETITDKNTYIYDKDDNEYKTANKLFFDKLQNSGSFIINSVESGDTVILDPGKVNLIYYPGQVQLISNINLQIEFDKSYRVVFYTQVNSINWETQYGPYNQSIFPTFACLGDDITLEYKKVVDLGGSIYLLKDEREKIFFCGRVSAADLNNISGTTGSVVFTSNIPAKWCVERFYARSPYFIYSGSNPFTAVISTPGGELLATNAFISNNKNHQISNILSYNDTVKLNLGISQVSVDFTWQDPNLQNYTDGYLDVYAVIKKLDIILY